MIRDIAKHNQEVKGNERIIDILHSDFPQCFTHDGKFDMEVFKEIIGESVTTTNEGYSLQFLGKSYASLMAATDTTTVVVPDEDHNSKPENINSQNIYISGDNLDALKHLRNSYSEAIKCIYIDPPYNTGSDGFVYNDKFNYTSEQLQSKLGISETAAQRILEMATRGSTSHSAWLAFMFPRLLLAKDLLSKDGVIFISIDDNEQANLKLLCDTVFGEENLVAQFCKKGTGGRQDSAHYARIHEYVLAYANCDFTAGEMIKESESYPLTDTDGKKYRRILLRKWGDASRRSDRPNMFYPLYFTDDRISLNNDLGEIAQTVYPRLDANTDGRWRWGMDTMQIAIDKNLVEIINTDEGYVAYEKIYEPSDDEMPTKLYTTWIDNINPKGGKALLKELFDGISPFEYPKPIDLIKLIIKMGNAVDGIVMDFFSGSATTAHAVMSLNSEDNDHRKFILVQCPEKIKDTSDAAAMGYSTIDEIGQARIMKAAQKIKGENPLFSGDLGFKHYTLVEPSDQTFAKLEEFNPCAIFADNILDEFGIDTILCTWALRDGYGLNAEIKTITLDNYTAYLCGRHLYFINPGLIDEAGPDPLIALIEKYNNDKSFKPETIVLFGYSFTYTETEALKKNLLPLRDGIKNLKVNLDIRY